ncbi:MULTISPECIES: CoxG family protein [unclassified Bradyrhizobium]|uniref:CoxG family protein n=1 Tax=unclassified Bradyrhizobium TaxID=2631580 RepID=UPI002915E843|nr:MULTISPECIES: SRPBCC domain-containing protein [unclassified Bradyrhizobium]
MFPAKICVGRIIGERLIPAPIGATWEALNDPEALKACIAGCESLEAVEADTFVAVLAARVGPISARFKGMARLSNIQPPNSYEVTFEGQGGIAGFGKGSAEVSLTEQGYQTLLRYSARAQVGGRLAQVGSRLIDAAVGKITEDFFSAFEARLKAASGNEAANENSVLRQSWAFVPSHQSQSNAASKNAALVSPPVHAFLRPPLTQTLVHDANVQRMAEAPARRRLVRRATPIELVGERLIDAPLFVTFNALNNVEVLRRCIPGCKRLDQVRAHVLEIELAMGVGPLSLGLEGTIQVSDVHVPTSYVLSFKGRRGTKGSGKISLTEEGRQTRVRYVLQAEISGHLARVGSRLNEMVAAILVRIFVSAFKARLRAEAAELSTGRSKIGSPASKLGAASSGD